MLVLVLGALLTAGAASRQDLPSVSGSHGAFAFPNRDGTELIVRHDVPNAANYRTAICGGRLLPIRFVRQQTGAGMPAADRDVPAQFPKLVGTVFQVLERGAGPDDTCFVAVTSLIEKAELVPVRARPQQAKCTEAEQRRVAALRERRIESCWSIAAEHVMIVQYARIQKDALASLVVLTPAAPITIDFPATFRSAGEDLWRVDDGGVFSPEGINVAFVLRRDGVYLVGLDWRGAEGSFLPLYAAVPGGSAQKVLADYWYRAPY